MYQRNKKNTLSKLKKKRSHLLTTAEIIKAERANWENKKCEFVQRIWDVNELEKIAYFSNTQEKRDNYIRKFKL